MKLLVKIIAAVFGCFVFVTVLAIIFSLPVKLLWNALMPEIFGLPTVNLWQAFGILVLSGFLFRSNAATSTKD